MELITIAVPGSDQPLSLTLKQAEDLRDALDVVLDDYEEDESDPEPLSPLKQRVGACVVYIVALMILLDNASRTNDHIFAWMLAAWGSWRLVLSFRPELSGHIQASAETAIQHIRIQYLRLKERS